MLLTDTISSQFRIDETQKKALAKLGILTVRDLLYYFPSRYSDMSEVRHIENVQDGETVTLLGKISKLETKKGFKSKIPMGHAELADITGKIKIVWFHQPYLAKMLRDGAVVRVTGKVSDSKSYGLTLTNPEITKEDILPIDTHDSLFTNDRGKEQYGYPIYAETKGITSKWMYHTIGKIIKSGALDTLQEYIPENILHVYKLPSIKTAFIWIHAPKKKNDADAARKRFAFEEVFFIQLARQQERKAYEALYSYKLKIPEADIKDFISRFPFKATEAQMKTIHSILADFQKDKAMSRLVEGDVGSGKTFVAATVAYAVIKNRPVGQNFGNIQVAYMAPTEVLATQLFESFISYFKHTGISIGLMTGSGCRKFPSKVASKILRANSENTPAGICATSSENLSLQARMRMTEGVFSEEANTAGGMSAGEANWTTISRAQLLKWVKNGEIPILIGTHALIAKSVDFEDLGLVIIDEQHRFGTNQRMKLAKKEGHAPHYLSMTATPIPRTLALTIYGDLDLSVIDEMPAGRKKVITEIVSPAKRAEAYEKIRTELAEGRQAYVICPRIDEPDPDAENALQMKNVTTEAKRLKKEVFPEYKIEVMHSKMTKQKKEAVMKDFYEHKIDILVSTSVIEVGVNVPNATTIIIEGAERFGLAQLHQLRGRVIRSNHQSYCYLFADAKTQKTLDRLKALTKAANGFELAELDLSLRGAGELGGAKQWGITDLGMEAIKNLKMVEAARYEAIALIEKDSSLKNYPLLSRTLASKHLDLHFE